MVWGEPHGPSPVDPVEHATEALRRLRTFIESTAPGKTKPCEYCPAWEWLNDPSTVAGERAIRRDERRRIARMVTDSFRHDEEVLLKLARRLQEPKVRRAGGLLVHALVSVLTAAEQDDNDDQKEPT